MTNKNFEAVMFPIISLNGGSSRVLTVKLINGNDWNTSLNGSVLWNFFAAAKMLVGSGSSEPTIDDYRLENELDGVLTVLSTGNDSSTLPITIKYSDENYHYIQVTRTYRNDTDHAITVCEAAVWIPYSNYNFIVSRDVIDPVVIDVGEAKSFTISIDRNFTQVTTN